VEGGGSIVVGVLQEEERTAAVVGLQVRREIFRGELELGFSKITTVVIFKFNLRG